MELDHAGVATDDATALVALYTDLLDCEVAHEEELDDMAIAFLDLGNTYVEVIEPLDDEGAIARYLDGNGPGIHHLAVETDDVAAALDHARNLGVETIDEEPRPGAWGHTVAFLHPASTGGVLLEFVEH